MALILNKSQAEAVYSAMRALNNVNASIGTVDMRGAKVEGMGPYILVTKLNEMGGKTSVVEHYKGQNAFAAAYGLV